MANKTKFLVIIGVLIGIGAALLFVGSHSITADIIIQEGQIDKTNSMRIEVILDPEINTEAVFAVQTLEETKERVLATVFDPNGAKIIAVSINQNSFEEVFEISKIGTYTLVIEAQNDYAINVIGGIGHVPNNSLYSISMAGFFMLLAGMISVIVLGTILVKERKKKLS